MRSDEYCSSLKYALLRPVELFLHDSVGPGPRYLSELDLIVEIRTGDGVG